MAFVGPLDSFNSNPIQTKVGTSQTNIFTATSTKVNKDSSGKVTGGTTTLYYSGTAGNYVPAATTADGGKTWTYLKDSAGKEILGADAKTSLQQGALKNNTQQQIISATKKGPLGGGGLTPEEQKTVAPSTQNVTTTPSGGNAGAAGTSSAPQYTLDDLSQAVAGGDIRKPNEYSNLKYPELMDPTQDCITFTMIEYVPKKVNTNVLGNLQNFGGDQIFTKPDGTSAVPGGTVTLPIQPTITDSNSVQWNDSTMSAIQATAGAGALGLMTDAPQPPSTATDETKGENAAALKSLAAYTFAQKAAGGEGGGFLTRATGAIVNPNLELLFEGPTLRNFSFTFTMSARQPSEAIIIKKIIRFFKQGMSVKRAQSALFLKSPHVFRIKYLYQGNKDHPWINKIKECALTSCSVNYTPSGSYATFEDGAMTQYDLSLSFTELEPIYDDDYTNLDGNKDEFIGY